MGRLTGFADGSVKIDVAAVKQKGKAKKAAAAAGASDDVMEIALREIEKANLVAEI